MKNLLILAVLLSLSALLPAQNNNSNDDISKLKQQVASLTNNNTTLKIQLKEIERKNLKIQDSLLSIVKDNNVKIQALQDAFNARETDITASRHRTDFILHSLKLRKVTLFILVPVLVLLLILLYWLLLQKITTTSEKNEKLAININHTLEESIQNNKIAVLKEISSVKEVLERKIANRS